MEKLSEVTKRSIKSHLETKYGQEMIQLHGISYIKKEIFHGIKNQKIIQKFYRDCKKGVK